MAATHHGYKVLKMPGSGGIITVACNEKDAVCSLERAYQAAAVESSDAEGFAYPPEAVPKKERRNSSRPAGKGRRSRTAPKGVFGLVAQGKR
jgi:hypothetical protein